MSLLQRRHVPSARQVFEILVREHADMLTAYLRSLVRSGRSVDDLFQDTVLAAWAGLDRFDQSRPFGPWLRGIARRRVLMECRAERARGWCMDPEVLCELDRRYDGLDPASAEVFRRRAEVLLGCLARLPVPQREVIEMVYGRGMSVRSAAEHTESTEEATKKRIQRTRQALAECLRAKEVLL